MNLCDARLLIIDTMLFSCVCVLYFNVSGQRSPISFCVVIMVLSLWCHHGRSLCCHHGYRVSSCRSLCCHHGCSRCFLSFIVLSSWLSSFCICRHCIVVFVTTRSSIEPTSFSTHFIQILTCNFSVIFTSSARIR